MVAKKMFFYNTIFCFVAIFIFTGCPFQELFNFSSGEDSLSNKEKIVSRETKCSSNGITFIEMNEGCEYKFIFSEEYKNFGNELKIRFEDKEKKPLPGALTTWGWRTIPPRVIKNGELVTSVKKSLFAIKKDKEYSMCLKKNNDMEWEELVIVFYREGDNTNIMKFIINNNGVHVLNPDNGDNDVTHVLKPDNVYKDETHVLNPDNGDNNEKCILDSDDVKNNNSKDNNQLGSYIICKEQKKENVNYPLLDMGTTTNAPLEDVDNNYKENKKFQEYLNKTIEGIGDDKSITIKESNDFETRGKRIENKNDIQTSTIINLPSSDEVTGEKIENKNSNRKLFVLKNPVNNSKKRDFRRGKSCLTKTIKSSEGIFENKKDRDKSHNKNPEMYRSQQVIRLPQQDSNCSQNVVSELNTFPQKEDIEIKKPLIKTPERNYNTVKYIYNKNLSPLSRPEDIRDCKLKKNENNLVLLQQIKNNEKDLYLLRQVKNNLSKKSSQNINQTSPQKEEKEKIVSDMNKNFAEEKNEGGGSDINKNFAEEKNEVGGNAINKTFTENKNAEQNFSINQTFGKVGKEEMENYDINKTFVDKEKEVLFSENNQIFTQKKDEVITRYDQVFTELEEDKWMGTVEDEINKKEIKDYNNNLSQETILNKSNDSSYSSFDENEYSFENKTPVNNKNLRKKQKELTSTYKICENKENVLTRCDTSPISGEFYNSGSYDSTTAKGEGYNKKTTAIQKINNNLLVGNSSFSTETEKFENYLKNSTMLKNDLSNFSQGFKNSSNKLIFNPGGKSNCNTPVLKNKISGSHSLLDFNNLFPINSKVSFQQKDISKSQQININKKCNKGSSLLLIEPTHIKIKKRLKTEQNENVWNSIFVPGIRNSQLNIAFKKKLGEIEKMELTKSTRSIHPDFYQTERDILSKNNSLINLGASGFIKNKTNKIYKSSIIMDKKEFQQTTPSQRDSIGVEDVKIKNNNKKKSIKREDNNSCLFSVDAIIEKLEGNVFLKENKIYFNIDNRTLQELKKYKNVLKIWFKDKKGRLISQPIFKQQKGGTIIKNGTLLKDIKSTLFNSMSCLSFCIYPLNEEAKNCVIKISFGEEMKTITVQPF